MAEPYSHVGLWTLQGGEAEEGVGWVGWWDCLSQSALSLGLRRKRGSKVHLGVLGFCCPQMAL